jgi:hypothetical protein
MGDLIDGGREKYEYERYRGGGQFTSGPEDPGNLPHHPLSVATFVSEIRCDVRHAEGKERVIGVEVRRQIGGVAAIENAPGNLVGNDDGSPDGLFQR